MSLPPAQPAYILRGHAAQIHSTTFIRSNSRLVTGDAEGWIVLWSLATKRATAVWRAHEAAILGTSEWGSRLITHGKDNRLIVWKLGEEDEADLSKALPVDDPGMPRKQPWILHILEVNTLNFCAFASCKARGTLGNSSPTGNQSENDDDDALLVAVPNAITSEAVDIFHLPSEKRLYTVSGPPSTNTGMVMAVAIFYQDAGAGKDSGHILNIICGFESGHSSVVSQRVDYDSNANGSNAGGKILYTAQPHSQPILSLAISPDQTFYLTSGADAIIAKHPIPHAHPLPSSTSFPSNAPKSTQEPVTQPLKISQTKHSGQQSTAIRNDGRIFATAGWDARVRVYAAGSLRELAVLKWHKEGCFAVALAEVAVVGVGASKDDGKKGEPAAARGKLGAGTGTGTVGEVEGGESKAGGGDGKGDKEQEQGLVPRMAGMAITISAKEKRIQKASETHWLAAGSKDGKVSLWEIY